MTKKNVGLAKDEVIRIYESDRQDLNFIKSELKMGSRHNEGDVVHELLKMYKSSKIGQTPFLVRSPTLASLKLRIADQQTRLDEFQSLFENTQKTNQTLVKAINHLCEKHNEKYGEIIEAVKRE